MLERVESENKRQLTLHLAALMCDLVHRRAREQGKTQSKYIADLVSADTSKVREGGDSDEGNG